MSTCSNVVPFGISAGLPLLSNSCTPGPNVISSTEEINPLELLRPA